jgi:hypothetical protein
MKGVCSMTADIRVYDLKQGQFFSFERDGEKLIAVVLNNKQRLILSPRPVRFPRRPIENYHASAYHGVKLVPERAARNKRKPAGVPANGEIIDLRGELYMFIAGDGGREILVDIKKWETVNLPPPGGPALSAITKAWELQDGDGKTICRFPE